MPLSKVDNFEILSGYRPRSEKRFYFFIVNKGGKRIFKHCIWMKKESEIYLSLSLKELTDYFIEIGLKRVKEKIRQSDYSNTLEIFEKNTSYTINLDKVKDKVILDW